LTLGWPPRDLMTLAMNIAAYGFLLGALRLVIAIRLQSADLV